MYRQPEIWIEDICYEPEHIQKVLKEIQKNFNKYFSDFVDTTAGTTLMGIHFASCQLVEGSPSSIGWQGRS